MYSWCYSFMVQRYNFFRTLVIFFHRPRRARGLRVGMFHVKHLHNGLNFSALQPTTTAPATANAPKLPQQYFAGVSIRNTSRPGAGGRLRAPGHGRKLEGPGETTPRCETNRRQHTTGSPHGGAAAGGTTCGRRRCAAPRSSSPWEGGGGRKGNGDGQRAQLALAHDRQPPRGRRRRGHDLRGAARTPRAGAGAAPKAARTWGRRQYFSARAGTAGARRPHRPETPSQ